MVDMSRDVLRLAERLVMHMLDWSGYRQQVLAGVGTLGKLSPASRPVLRANDRRRPTLRPVGQRSMIRVVQRGVFRHFCGAGEIERAVVAFASEPNSGLIAATAAGVLRHRELASPANAR